MKRRKTMIIMLTKVVFIRYSPIVQYLELTKPRLPRRSITSFHTARLSTFTASPSFKVRITPYLTPAPLRRLSKPRSMPVWTVHMRGEGVIVSMIGGGVNVGRLVAVGAVGEVATP